MRRCRDWLVTICLLRRRFCLGISYSITSHQCHQRHNPHLPACLPDCFYYMCQTHFSRLRHPNIVLFYGMAVSMRYSVTNDYSTNSSSSSINNPGFEDVRSEDLERGLALLKSPLHDRDKRSSRNSRSSSITRRSSDNFARGSSGSGRSCVGGESGGGSGVDSYLFVTELCDTSLDQMPLGLIPITSNSPSSHDYDTLEKGQSGRQHNAELWRMLVQVSAGMQVGISLSVFCLLQFGQEIKLLYP